MIVIDASAFIDAVDGRNSVLGRLGDEDIHAPHLLDVEVASALRRLVARGRFEPERAADALATLEHGDIKRHPHSPLLGLIWSLRDRVSVYDATYVALAAALNVPLVTADRKLAGVPDLPCTVEVP